MNRIVGHCLWSLGVVLSACGGVAEDENAAQGTEALRGTPVEEVPQEEVAPTRTGRTGTVIEEVSEPAIAASGPKPTTGVAPEPTTFGTTYPKFADLRPDGIMLIHYLFSQKNPWIRVFNYGPGAINTSAARVEIGGLPYKAMLRTLDAHLVTGSNPLAPGQAGYLATEVPLSAVQLCSTYQVKIDVDRTLQWRFDFTDVYSNDTGTVKSQCLYWTSPLSEHFLESDYNEHVDDLVRGATLQEIVGGKHQGVDAGKCTHCHNNSPNPIARVYRPPVAMDGVFVPDKDTYYDGRKWAGPGGWAERFLSTAYAKPDHMKGAFSRWLAHGAR